MKAITGISTSLLALPFFLGCIPVVWAGPIVWLLSPVSGDIVRIDPNTGSVLGAFAAPIAPLQGDTRAGLTIADGGKTLLYQLGNNGAGTEIDGREILYGLDPFTGAIKYQAKGLGSSFGPDGMSWQSQGGSTFTFINHANPIPDIHRVENIGSPSVQEIIFWGPTQYPEPFNHSVGGLGGDGNGREFGVFIDIDDLFAGHRFIGEYDPFENTPDFLNTFVAPADDLVGLAFDGRFLYASGASGALYTLDPNTGAIIRSVQLAPLFFGDGSPAPYQFDIAAAVAEPNSIFLLGIGLMGMAIRFAGRRSSLPVT